MTTKMRIGKTRIESGVFAAPMSGVTDLPFRRVLQSFKPGLVVSEMVASETLLKGDADTEARAAGKGDIDPLVIQLVGREPIWMARGANRAEDAGADIIDINMGCPARKVTSGLSGSALMKDIKLAMEIIEAVIGATSLPVTLKMRLGWDDTMLNAPELAAHAESAGIQLVTVHGRTRCQFYKGEADWKAIAPVKDSVKIPVIANGDIETPSDALKALEYSGCDGVMVGRGLIGAPWKLWQIMKAVDGVNDNIDLSAENKLRVIIDHYRDILQFYGEGKGLRIARKHLSGYVDNAPVEIEPSARANYKSEICQSLDPNYVESQLCELYRHKEMLAA